MTVLEAGPIPQNKRAKVNAQLCHKKDVCGFNFVVSFSTYIFPRLPTHVLPQTILGEKKNSGSLRPFVIKRQPRLKQPKKQRPKQLKNQLK